MDSSQSHINQLQRPKKPKSGLTTTELVIWSIATLVVSLFIFGAIATIPFAPQLASIFNPSQNTSTAVPARLPSATPIQTAASAAADVVQATPSPVPPSTEIPGLKPTEGSPQLAQVLFTSTTESGSSSGTPPPTPTLLSTALTRTGTACCTPTPTSTRTLQPTPTRTERAFVPTDTPTPTPTETVSFVEPTPTETLAPTTSPDGWNFANVRLDPDANRNELWVYGIAVNNTGSTQEIEGIVGTFYDDGDDIIAFPGNTSDYIPVDILPPGGSVPFAMWVGGITSAARYELRVDAVANDQTPRMDGFELTIRSQYTETESGEYCVAATVKNTGGQLAEYLTIDILLFDAQNGLINLGVGDDFMPGEVPPNEPLEFDICVDPLEEDLTGARHELLTWGR